MAGTLERYRAQAEQAERAAKAAITPDERAAYEKIATLWRKLEAEYQPPKCQDPT